MTSVDRAPVSGAWMARAMGAVAIRPWLWGTAVGQLRRLARPGWWREAPHLPLPDPVYLRFRLVTAYGAEGREPSAVDLRPASPPLTIERRNATQFLIR